MESIIGALETSLTVCRCEALICCLILLKKSWLVEMKSCIWWNHVCSVSSVASEKTEKERKETCWTERTLLVSRTTLWFQCCTPQVVVVAVSPVNKPLGYTKFYHFVNVYDVRVRAGCLGTRLCAQTETITKGSVQTFGRSYLKPRCYPVVYCSQIPSSCRVVCSDKHVWSVVLVRPRKCDVLLVRYQ